MSNWQASEEQARVVTAVARDNRHDWENRVRAAITAAVGPEVNALLEELSALCDQCERILKHDPKPIEFLSRLDMDALPDYVRSARAVLAKTGGGE